ncbi:hypothetical protein BKA62DRAFT_755028 [Auriculariales sp. MPI-PUGE-AT-0066]|nr:hypothetical protein BKA62DRAFT_755028 [Auriculariales sp. MPI-PUGE-AT-0066]
MPSKLREKQPVGNVSSTEKSSDMSRFYREVAGFEEDLRRYEAEVKLLVELRQRVLDTIDSADAARMDVQREELRRFSESLTKRLLAFESGDAVVVDEKRADTALVKAKFISAMRRFQSQLKAGEDTNKRNIERLLKQLKPDVTPTQVELVLEGRHQALMQLLPTSVTESRVPYQELETRLDQLHKIEATLADIATHLQELGVALDQDDHYGGAADDFQSESDVDLEKNDRLLTMAMQIEREHRRIRVGIFFGTIVAIIIIVVSIVCPVAILTND